MWSIYYMLNAWWLIIIIVKFNRCSKQNPSTCAFGNYDWSISLALLCGTHWFGEIVYNDYVITWKRPLWLGRDISIILNYSLANFKYFFYWIGKERANVRVFKTFWSMGQIGSTRVSVCTIGNTFWAN